MRGALRGAVALALLALASIAVAAAAFAGSPPQQVLPGGLVRVDVSGFAPRAAVVLHLAGHPGRRSVRANSAGRVHATFHAPTVGGSYRLLVVGTVRDAGAPTVHPGHPSPAEDPQNIDVVVPRVVTVPFVVTEGGSSGRGRPTGSGTGARVEGIGSARVPTSGPRGAAGGTLSATGSDLAPAVALGVAALVAGAAALLAGRSTRGTRPGRHR
jgi:hypothetical protein